MNPFPRGVHTFALRAGRMTDFQKRSYEELSPKYCVPYDAKAVLDFGQVFERVAPTVVEIGFGMGSSTVLIAEANPGVNYLGIEVHTPGVGKLLSEIEARGLRNLRIVHHDAVEVISDMIAPGSLDGFHIFFPDPWPKKRHHKRRLAQRPFTTLLASRLKEGGYLHFATDWEEYAEFALEELCATPGFRNASSVGYFEGAEGWRPVTKFERRAETEGRPVREIRMIRNSEPVSI